MHNIIIMATIVRAHGTTNLTNHDYFTYFTINSKVGKVSIVGAWATNSMLGTIVLECVSMATLVCAHGTTILTNRELSELVTFMGKDMDYVRKKIVWKIFSLYI